jgi:hypothetical protein
MADGPSRVPWDPLKLDGKRAQASKPRQRARPGDGAESLPSASYGDPAGSVGGSTPLAPTITTNGAPFQASANPYSLAEAPGAASPWSSETSELCWTLFELDSWHDQIGSVAGVVGSKELVLFFHPLAP